MTFHSQKVLLDLWCAQPVLQGAVAIFFWRRKLHKQFPVFFAFLVAQVLNFAITFPLWLLDVSRIYTGFFWLGEAVNAFLGFKVIHEIFLDVFRPYHTLKDLGTLLFKWAGIVMLLVSVVVAFSSSSDQSPAFQALTTLQRSVRVIQLGLILFLLLFSRFLGVSRKQTSFGISLGFGLIAGADLLLLALQTGGLVGWVSMNLLNMTTYLVAVIVWLAYSLSRVSVRLPSANRLQTERWEQGLADLQAPVPSDSLIPMFEGMVERAFSRSSSLDSVDPEIELQQPFIPPKAHSAKAGSKEKF